jgi:hypothetical protein
MPQLDQFTYLSQFVWLCVFFVSYYILVYNDALPKISRILKLRARLVSQQDSSQLDHNNNQEAQGDAVITQSLDSCTAYLSSSVSNASQWCNEMVASLNANQLEPVNHSYVRSLAEITLSEVIKGSVLDTISPPTPVFFTKHASVRMNPIYVLRMQTLTLGHVKNGPRKKRSQHA